MKSTILPLALAASQSFAQTDSVRMSVLGSWLNDANMFQVSVQGDSLAWCAGLTRTLALLDVKDPTRITLKDSLKVKRQSSLTLPWKERVVSAFGDAGPVVLSEWVGGRLVPVDSILSLEGPGTIEFALTDTLLVNPIYTGGLGIHRLNALSRLERIGYLELPGSVWSVCLRDTLAFVSLGTQGTALVSIANPWAPRLLSTLPNSDGEVFQTLIANGVAWTMTNQGLVSGFAIQDPLKPVALGSIRLTSFSRRMAFHGNHLFVTNPSSVSVVDISIPSKPVLVGRIAASTAMPRPHGIAVTATRLYVTNETSGLTVLRWTSRKAPKLVAPSSYAREGSVAFQWSPNDTNETRLTLSTFADLRSPLVNIGVRDSAMVVSLTPGTYYWNVKGSDSVPSTTSKLVVLASSIPLPYRFDGSAVSETDVVLKWKGVDGFSLPYKVELSRSSSFSGAIGLSTQDTLVRPGFTLSLGLWYWRVSAAGAASPIDSMNVVPSTSVRRLPTREAVRVSWTGGDLVVVSDLPVEIVDLQGRLLATGTSRDGVVRFSGARTRLRDASFVRIPGRGAALLLPRL